MSKSRKSNSFYHYLLTAGIATMLVCCLLPCKAATFTTDSISSDSAMTGRIAPWAKQNSIPDTVDTNRNWWYLLKKGKLNLEDETVEYPRFVKFCVDVYNWGNRVFNETDTTYVQGTGKRWKVMLRNDNWVDSYAMNLDNTNIQMLSDIVCNVGVYLAYMAVSVGYNLDMTNIIGNRPISHKKFEFNFNCARFSIDVYYNENNGGTYIRRLTDYKDGRFFKHHLPDLTLKNYGIDAYFFFNNYHYSNGAAYNFSRIQRKSAGSLVTGFTISNQDISFDLSSLPDYLKKYIHTDRMAYTFHYNDYALVIGYAYNWVFARNWLFNISALPSFGFKHCFEDCTGGKRDLFSFNIKGRLSFTYNYRDFFASLIGRMTGHWYFSSNYWFFNSVENLMLTVGLRF